MSSSFKYVLDIAFVRAKNHQNSQAVLAVTGMNRLTNFEGMSSPVIL